MSDLSTSGRLELIRQIRASYDRNMNDMSDRERLLYGDSYTQNLPQKGMSLFKVRLIAGILLFFLFFAMDSTRFTIAGHTADELFDAISYDFVEDIDSFLNQYSAETDN